MTNPLNIRRALISVYDKTGVVEFARALHAEFGIELISTGGTAKVLQEAGLPVTLVEQLTGSPEMMDGRVKTLHPTIHAAILADRDNPEHMRQLAGQGIEPIDMVVVNLYPFEQTIAKPGCTFEEAIEMIDIGGPCLLRAAAKNHKDVVCLSRASLYEPILEHLRRDKGVLEGLERRELARFAFQCTTYYDREIWLWLRDLTPWILEAPPDPLPARRLLAMRRQAELRYGENPHQRAAYYSSGSAPKIAAFSECAGSSEPLSYNNYADASAALELCVELTRADTAQRHRLSAGVTRGSAATRDTPAVCFVKHTNACGAAVEFEPLEAYRKAYLGDPNAAMGGILAVNFAVTPEFAEAVMETYQRWGKAAGAGGFFVEVWLAPSFDETALEVIRTKKDWGKRVRLLGVGDLTATPDPHEMDFKRIAGGMLMQSRDLVGLNEDQWKVVTDRTPTEAEMNDLRLAWLICKHTKSNAITICKGGMLIGNGAGQMSRVMSCRIATWLAQENGHADQLKGAVAASDAFFPFRDGPDILTNAGVGALIQPGGSKRDEDTIKACNERGVAMIFTGTRHFRH